MEDSEEESDENVDDQEEAENDEKALEGNLFIFMVGKCRRLKERKIKHVIEKVLKWRQLYARNAFYITQLKMEMKMIRCRLNRELKL